MTCTEEAQSQCDVGASGRDESCRIVAAPDYQGHFGKLNACKLRGGLELGLIVARQETLCACRPHLHALIA